MYTRVYEGSHLSDDSTKYECAPSSKTLSVVHTAVEGSELYCYNTNDDKNSVVSQASCSKGCTLFELQGETGIEKRTIHNILREDLQLGKTASKWVPHTLTEVEQLTRYAICHLLFLIYIIHTSKSPSHHQLSFVYFHVSS